MAFAIFYPGYGDDNYAAFKQVFERNGMEIMTVAAKPDGLPPMRPMVAQQSDGHAEVVLKNMPGPEGSVVAKVPNGQPLTFLADHGDYVRVCWQHTEGYARRENVVKAAPAQSFVAKQADGHAEVVLKSSPNSQGSVVAKVPNGQAFVLLGDHGDYVKVRWEDEEGYARKENVVQENSIKQES